MATHLRILVLDPGPLDGVTPLPVNARGRVTADPQLGIPTLTLNAGERLGVFDPGALVFGRSGSYVLRHIAVMSSNGTPHADGTFVGVRSPSRPGGGSTTRALRLLGLGDEPDLQGTGVIPEGSSVPVPVGHFVVVDTIADGPAPGPHLVQLSFDAAEAPPFELSSAGQTRNVCSPPGLRAASAVLDRVRVDPEPGPDHGDRLGLPRDRRRLGLPDRQRPAGVPARGDAGVQHPVAGRGERPDRRGDGGVHDPDRPGESAGLLQRARRRSDDRSTVGDAR